MRIVLLCFPYAGGYSSGTTPCKGPYSGKHFVKGKPVMQNILLSKEDITSIPIRRIAKNPV